MKLAQKTTLARYALSLSVVCGISLGINTSSFAGESLYYTFIPIFAGSNATTELTNGDDGKRKELLSTAKPEAQHYLAQYYAGNNPDLQGYETLQSLISLAHADGALSSQTQNSPNQPQLSELDLVFAIANLE